LILHLTFNTTTTSTSNHCITCLDVVHEDALFGRHPAVHHHPTPASTTYGSAAEATAGQSEVSEPSVDSGEPSSNVHVAGRRHRWRRGRRSQRQSNVEDV